MTLDPNKLSRNELVQLLNSTSLGECLTRGRLNSQMNRAGWQWADGALSVTIDQPLGPQDMLTVMVRW